MYTYNDTGLEQIERESNRIRLLSLQANILLNIISVNTKRYVGSSSIPVRFLVRFVITSNVRKFDAIYEIISSEEERKNQLNVR